MLYLQFLNPIHAVLHTFKYLETIHVLFLFLLYGDHPKLLIIPSTKRLTKVKTPKFTQQGKIRD